MSEKMRGECLCGKVHFELADPEAMGVCHCTRCQRWTGSGRNFFVMGPEAKLTVTTGNDGIGVYQTEGFGDRIFCSTCGSSLYARSHGKCFVCAGTVRSPHDMVPSFHLMVAYKLPWDQISDDAPQFAELPPQG